MFGGRCCCCAAAGLLSAITATSNVNKMSQAALIGIVLLIFFSRTLNEFYAQRATFRATSRAATIETLSTTGRETIVLWCALLNQGVSAGGLIVPARR
jgi:hypothetical protein